jgi:hypothetical protein
MPAVLAEPDLPADADAPSEPRPRRRVVALGPALAAEQTKSAPFAVRSSLLPDPSQLDANSALQPHASAQTPPSSSGPPAPRAPQTPAAAESTSDGEWLRLAMVLAALMFAGFAGWRMLQTREPGARASVTARATGAVTPQDVARTQTSASLAGAGASTEPARAGAIAPSDAVSGFGRVLPFIDRNRGVSVAAEQGLLVVESEVAGAAPRVRIGGRDLGMAPIAVALLPGRHELVLNRDGRTSFRYVVVRAGETLIVQIRD